MQLSYNSETPKQNKAAFIISFFKQTNKQTHTVYMKYLLINMYIIASQCSSTHHRIGPQVPIWVTLYILCSYTTKKLFQYLIYPWKIFRRYFLACSILCMQKVIIYFPPPQGKEYLYGVERWKEMWDPPPLHPPVLRPLLLLRF